MKRKVLILLIFIAFGFSVNGQDKSITEFDLYGDWVLDSNKTKQDEGKLIYKKQEDSKTELKKGISVIYFEAFEECKLTSYIPFICGNEAPSPDYTWTFEEDTGIINIYSSKKWLKEFKEKYPEEHEKFGSPDKFDEMKLKVVQLLDGTIGLEKIRTKTYSK